MRTLLLSLFLGLSAPAVQAAMPPLNDIAVIPIHDGINDVPGFAADGRNATIARAWRDNGDAHGHYVYLVLLPLKESTGSRSKIGVVTFDGGKPPLADTANISPFDEERVLGTLRFARAKIGGAPATVMIRADLAETANGVLADHAPVNISIYKLENPGVDAGTTPDVFRLAGKVRPKGRLCNADMALATALHLALPAGYAGGKAPNGCGG